MKPSLITLLAGIALLVPAMLGASFSGIPSVPPPYPALVVIPMFFLGLLALFLPSLLFFAWHPTLFKGSNVFPKRTYILFVVLVVLTVPWFIVSWKFGLQYQGARFTYFACGVNAAWIAALTALLWRCWRKNNISFPSSLLVHWVLFAWLAWWAFPYLGELP